MKIDEALCSCTVLESVRRVDQNPALPFGQPAQDRLNPYQGTGVLVLAAAPRII